MESFFYWKIITTFYDGGYIFGETIQRTAISGFFVVCSLPPLSTSAQCTIRKHQPIAETSRQIRSRQLHFTVLFHQNHSPMPCLLFVLTTFLKRLTKLVPEITLHASLRTGCMHTNSSWDMHLYKDQTEGKHNQKQLIPDIYVRLVPYLTSRFMLKGRYHLQEWKATTQHLLLTVSFIKIIASCS